MLQWPEFFEGLANPHAGEPNQPEMQTGLRQPCKGLEQEAASLGGSASHSKAAAERVVCRTRHEDTSLAPSRSRTETRQIRALACPSARSPETKDDKHPRRLSVPYEFHIQ